MINTAEERIKNYFICELVTKSDSLREEVTLEELGVDGLYLDDLAIFLENEFSIEISNEDQDKLKTLKDVFDLVNSKI